MRDGIDFLVGTAVRAPSVHNTQPWRFRIRAGCIELLADRSRQLEVIDPDGRQLVISCGAALFNLRLAVHHLGYCPVVHLLPERNDPDLLARLSLGTVSRADPAEELMLSALHRRHTHRARFQARPPTGVLVSLQDAAAAEGAELHLVHDAGAVCALARLVQLADRAELADPDYVAEILAWTAAPDAERRDGVPARAYPETGADTPMASRNFRQGGEWRLMDGWGDRHSVLAVLVTAGDHTKDWLVAGQALQRVLLLGAATWVFAAFWGQPVELNHVRELVRGEMRLSGFPQHIMQLGYAPDAGATPRRPVPDVVIADGA